MLVLFPYSLFLWVTPFSKPVLHFICIINKVASSGACSFDSEGLSSGKWGGLISKNLYLETFLEYFRLIIKKESCNFLLV